jgi:Domain of unknown function (DUF4388)
MDAQGSVTDRPWGVTLGAIAQHRHTGQLTIESDGKRYSIVFHDGSIVAASSPLAADALPRIALTNHFITSTQVADITRRIAGAPDRDEVEVLAEAIRCSPDQVGKLRHRLVAQRAARTFSLEHGEFMLDGRVTLPVVAGVAVDHRHVIYLGVRTNLAEQRLIDELRQLGSYFLLKPEAIGDLPRFGFEPHTHTVLEALKAGTGLPELEASHRELDPRSAQAVIYALVSCTACVILPRTATPPATAPRGATPALLRSKHPTAPGSTEAGDRKLSTDRIPLVNTVLRMAKPAAPSTSPPSDAPMLPPVARGTGPLPGDRTTTSPLAPRTRAASVTAYSGAAAQDTGTNTPAATRSRAPSVISPVLPPTASPAIARPRTPTAPPHGHLQAPDAAHAGPDDAGKPAEGPSRLSGSARPRAVTFGDPQPTRARSPTGSPTASRPAVSRVPTSDAEVLRGFADQHTPSGFTDQRTPGFAAERTPADQRTPTDAEFARATTGGPATSRVSTEDAVAAEQAFKRGEAAMKRDQPGEAILEYKAACDLHPTEVDYAAMLAWSKFCAAGDKPAIGAETRKILERAVFKSHRPERARFYLGRVERMLGRDKEALRHFQEVLDLKPNHAEAASEVRTIEARLQAGKPGPGLFGRKR